MRLQDDSRYDIGNALDVEKHPYHIREPSLEYDSDSSAAESSQTRDTYESHDPILPHVYSSKTRVSRRLRSLYFYRVPNRIMRWLCLALFSTMVFFILGLVRMSWDSRRQVELGALNERPSPPPVYESFDFLERYYGGLRTLISRVDNNPEYPVTGDPSPTAELSYATSKSIPYTIFRNKTESDSIAECFLDSHNKIRLPQIHAYNGVPAGFPSAAMGSYEVLDLDDTKCFDRYGRFGPYGFGYSIRKGGNGAGLTGENDGAEETWKERMEIDYTKVQWADAQERCLVRNSHRFSKKAEVKEELFRDFLVGRSLDQPTEDLARDATILATTTTTTTTTTTATTATTKPEIIQEIVPRSAVIIRTWSDLHFTDEDVLSLRSLISELSLQSGGQYTVHFLIHVKDDNAAIWSDPETYQRVLSESLPKEFQGMGTLWSERQMGLIYGGLAESFYRELPVHGVYRSMHLPLQYFAQKHPEYDYFWNWEFDVRYTGHWLHLFSAAETWAAAQPRKGLWERSGRFYIPEVHGSWEDFIHLVRVTSEMPSGPPAKVYGPPDAIRQPQKPEKPVWGPYGPEDALIIESDPIPPTSYEKDKYEWGVGEQADLIVFNPLFDPDQTGWYLAQDVTGYNTTIEMPPRRSAIITSARLSRRLLDTMHRETAIGRHNMFSEMWPASCALHHGLKAVYVPHPVYVDRAWPLTYLAGVMNGGRSGASGGARTSVFTDALQVNFRGVTWYYNSGFAPNLWRRWLGYKVNNDGGEAAEVAGEGRMCLPAMLLHPVKAVDLVVEAQRDEDAD